MSSVRFLDVGKKFVIRHERHRSFQGMVVNLFRANGQREEFWALQGVSFEVLPGETLGIVGSNGSGKSTILKLITRILRPTRGSVKVNGKVSALLELGAGFHPDLSGRDNVYLNGALLGLGRRQMEERLEAIVEFAELEHFIDVPIRHYSSGMYMRLAFAIAINVDPDILLIDEVLAVGDEAFQRRCLDKIGEFKREGKTIVLVSHDLTAVRNLCTKALWLEGGLVQAEGATNDVVDRYLESANVKDRARLREEQTVSDEESPSAATPQRRWGTREVEITGVELLDGAGEPTSVYATGETARLRIHYFAHQRVEKPVFGVAIHRSDGTHINGPNTRTSGYLIDSVEGEGAIDFVIPSLPLLEGNYLFSAAVYDFSCTHAYDHHDRLYPFRVQPKSIRERLGIFYIPCEWELR